MFSSIQEFLETHGGEGNMRIKSFPTKALAIEFYSKINHHQHCSIALVLPVFQVKDDPQTHYVAIKKNGELLHQFLSQKLKQMAFFDRVETVELTRVEEDQFAKLRISENYQKILRNLIELLCQLNEAEFRCILRTDTVAIWYPKVVFKKYENNHIFPHVIVSDFEVLDKAEPGMQWGNLVSLIEVINQNIAFEEAVSNLEMRYLIHLLQHHELECIHTIPLFWIPEKRVAFISSLSEYLIGHNRRFWHPALDAVFRNDWEQRAKQFGILEKHLKQDDIDKHKRCLRSPFRPNPDNPLAHDVERDKETRACIDFMRLTFEHFYRQDKAIGTKDKTHEVGSQEELQLYFEYVFPNHIQLLFERVRELEIPIL